MITVLIPTLNAEKTLARVFEPLVGPTVRGLVREVLVLDQGSTDATTKIAEAAGADLADGKAFASNGDWLLHLPQACVLDGNWEDEARRLMESAPGQTGKVAGLFRPLREDLRPAARWKERADLLQNMITGRPVANQAVLLPLSHGGQFPSANMALLLKGKKGIRLRAATTQLMT